MDRKLLAGIIIVAVVMLGGIALFAKDKNQSTVQNPPAAITENTGLVGGGPWVWQNTLYASLEPVQANNPDSFILVFNDDGTFSSTTDCNNLAGKYQKNGSELKLTEIASTLMFCEGSQEAEYAKMLGDVKSYSIPSAGNLQLRVNTDDGWMNFSNQ